MSQKNRHKILEVKAEVVNQTQKEAFEQQLVDAGFDSAQFTEFEKALLLQVGLIRTEIVEAIDEFGAMVEDYIGDGEEE